MSVNGWNLEKPSGKEPIEQTGPVSILAGLVYNGF